MMRTSTNRISFRESTTHGRLRAKATSFRLFVVSMVTVITVLLMSGISVAFQGCATGRTDDEYVNEQQFTSVSGVPECTVSEVRYPTTAQDFSDAHLLYGGRGFLSEYAGTKHLGRDIIYAQGTQIHPIACGTLRFYGPAAGYGTLVAVVEHILAVPVSVINGDGLAVKVNRFLTIYGHLRKNSAANDISVLPWKVGETVRPSDVLGYIQSDALNGDGPEHLHLGVRLQSLDQAKASDPSAWFRGNDTAGTEKYKKYYSDPATFIPVIMEADSGLPDVDAANQPTKATDFPLGTLLHSQADDHYWLVVEKGAVLNVDGYQRLRRECAIPIASSSLSCFQVVLFHSLSLELDARVVKFTGEPAVYRLTPGSGFMPSEYRPFISYDAFLSWGYVPADIEEYSLSQKAAVLNGLSEHEPVMFMPGALVKGKGQSEVAVADQQGQRRPLFNWDVFVALGYDASCIMEIEPATLDVCAGSRSNNLITLADTAGCATGAKGAVCVPGSSVPCGCLNNVPGTQSCLDNGEGYAVCLCQGGGGSVEVTCQGHAVNSLIEVACCVGGTMGKQVCLPDGTFSDCFDCQVTDSGNAPGCVPGKQESCSCSVDTLGYHTCKTDGSGFDDCYCATTGTGGSGAGGSSGTGGSYGAGGTVGSNTNIVTIKYTGKQYMSNQITATGQLNGAIVDLTAFDALPKDIMAWFDGNTSPNGRIDQNNDGTSDCIKGQQRDVSCTFTVPKGSSLLFQVSLGAYRFWGDASGNSPAPCIAENIVTSMTGTSVIVMGQVELFVNGVPFTFSIISNNYVDPNWQANGQKCGASHTPYYNGFAILP